MGRITRREVYISPARKSPPPPTPNHHQLFDQNIPALAAAPLLPLTHYIFLIMNFSWVQGRLIWQEQQNNIFQTSFIHDSNSCFKSLKMHVLEVSDQVCLRCSCLMPFCMFSVLCSILCLTYWPCWLLITLCTFVNKVVFPSEESFF